MCRPFSRRPPYSAAAGSRNRFQRTGLCRTSFPPHRNPVLQILARWATTLKFKIVTMAVVTGVLSAAGTATLVLLTMQRHMTEVLLESARDDRERTAALLSGKVTTLQDVLRAVAAHVPAEGWGDGEAMARFLISKPALGAMFDAVFVAAPDGRMLARVEKGSVGHERPNIADREYFQRAIQSDQPVISRPLKARVLKTPVVILAVPVLGPDGRAVGVLAGSTALQSSALFADTRTGDKGSPVSDLVMDRDGVLISHPDPARIMGRAEDEPGLGRVVADWRGSGSPIDTEAKAVLDGEHLVSTAGIPLTDWTLVRVTPAKLAFAPVTAARATAWQAALAAGAVAGLLAGALAFVLTRPMSRVHARALALLQPAAAHEVWPVEQGEVGELSRAFQTVVQQREQRQTEVQALVSQLEAILDHADVGIALTRNGRFELVSRQFCHVFRCDKLDMVGQPTRLIYASDEAFQSLAERARPSFMADGGFDGELELMRRSGQIFWARMRGRAVAPGDLSQGTIWTIEDVTATREQREKLTYEASHDALTGLANRPAFESALEQAIAEIDGQPLCVLFIDLDRFKHVNDSGGHAAGDALLRDVAKVLRAQVRRSDLVARLGGDEFAVLLPSCPLHHSRALAEKLCAAVAAYELVWEGQPYAVGASVGLTVVSVGGQTAADVLRAADAACYGAKRHGRSRVEEHAASEPGVLIDTAA